MWIVAIAWIYVVALMSFTETSFVAGLMTFIFYCVVPLSILYYLTGSRGRRAKRQQRERGETRRKADSADGDTSGGDSGGGDGGGGD